MDDCIVQVPFKLGMILLYIHEGGYTYIQHSREKTAQANPGAGATDNHVTAALQNPPPRIRLSRFQELEHRLESISRTKVHGKA